MYTYKQLADGSVSVYKNGLWQCFIASMELAKKIFEVEVKV
jgi:hypothetical protein